MEMPWGKPAPPETEQGHGLTIFSVPFHKSTVQLQKWNKIQVSELPVLTSIPALKSHTCIRSQPQHRDGASPSESSTALFQQELG